MYDGVSFTVSVRVSVSVKFCSTGNGSCSRVVGMMMLVIGIVLVVARHLYEQRS